MKRWWTQLMCAMHGHAGMEQIVCYMWRCKACGKIYNLLIPTLDNLPAYCYINGV